MSLKIRELELPSPIVIAPMAGVSTRAFRRIARQFGAGLVCNEMVSDKALHYDSARTKRMLACDEDDHPVSFQIFGHDIDTVVEAAKLLDTETDCDIIDFNMGCPVTKVIKAKAGSYLMKDIDYAKELVTAIVQNVKKPVTVKMRLGFDANSINCVEMAKAMEEAGASAITLHARTRAQMYEGEADWSWIKKVKDAVNIPVIGNGDVKSVEDAIRMMDETGCDGVMIGRGVVGNPFLIRECADYFSGEHHTFDLSMRMQACRDHAKYLCEDLDEKIALSQMRGLASWYLKGLPASRLYKDRLSKIRTYAELDEILTEYEDLLNREYFGPDGRLKMHASEEEQQKAEPEAEAAEKTETEPVAKTETVTAPQSGSEPAGTC